MNNQEKQERDKQYNEYVKRVTPTNNIFYMCLRAFVAGGLICSIGQFVMNILLENGVNKDDASLYVTIILILTSIILTGLNIYPAFAKWGGAGTLVPITGFANSVVSPAIEFKKEGQVFGIGCKIFTIAGPVILYGIFSSWCLGVVYWIGKILEIW